MYDDTPKWKQFEQNRRRYWKNQYGVLDVYSDTYGPTDLAVVFSTDVARKQKILLIEIKTDGELRPDRRAKLKEFLAKKPDNTELRIEFLQDPEGLCGQRNTTHTKLRTPADIDRHIDKTRDISSSE